MFPTEVRNRYVVHLARYGNGESEETIPLGSWRKGGGPAGSKGHVYVYGEGWAGVWLIHGHAAGHVQVLQQAFPSIVPMQAASGEATFRVPMADLADLLPRIKGKRRYKASPAQIEAARKGAAASPIIPGDKKDTATGDKTG